MLKKLTALFAFLFLTAFCFANGKLEEKKRIEQRILSHPAVESVYIWQHDARGKDFAWNIDIYLINNGYIFVSSNRVHCTEESLYTGCFVIERIGDYELRYNYGGVDTKTSSVTKFSFSSILQIKLNCIEDYINNYDKILQIVTELSKENIEERTNRLRKISYTDSDFLNYFGNCLSEDYWCKVFARPLSETSSWWSDIKW
ncbi:MAG: hypothetical protein MJ196_11230 [Treponemataceae bacterium]|nr:hypothetical protein [Treponemataceae bacterium]